MTELLTTISPLKSALGLPFYGLLLLTSFCFLMSYLLFRKRLLSTSRLNPILSMLVGFAALVLFGIALFTYVYSKKITDVDFTENAIHFGGKEILYKDIARHYIKPLQQQSRYSAQIVTDTSFIFVIEKKDKKAYLFSNEYYDLHMLKKTSNVYLK